jgi:hypothetical protein
MRITFEDHGQDFLTWQLDNNGIVVASEPFQSWVWSGVKVLHPDRLRAGSTLAYKRGPKKRFSTIRYPIASIEPTMSVDAFNDTYAVGTPCRYYPIAGDGEHLKTKIRSEAWTLGHGAVVVKIQGRRGGVDINHLVMEG